MPDPQGSQNKSVLERVLALVTEVRPGEATTALLLTLNVFLILTAYYIIKPVRDALVLTLEDGAELKAYAGGATAVLLLVAVPLYSALANRLARNRLIVGVTLFFVVCLVVFYGIGLREDLRSHLAIPFYLWVAIFNMMIVAQFWAFANDVYNEERGKRLFPLVGIGASLGASAGAALSAVLLDSVNVYALMLVSAAVLAITAALTQWVHVRESASADTASGPADGVPASRKQQPVEEDRSGAFTMVLRHRYLLLLATFSLLFTFVNSNGEYMLGAIVEAAALDNAQLTTDVARSDWIGQFYATFYLGVNILGVLLQTFVVSRLIKHGGLKLTFFVLPVLALLGASLIAVFPLLLVVRVSKSVENATDYSVNNTVRNMLWLPTTRQMKYKAKQAVDTFFVRMGDVSAGVFVYVGAAVLSLGVRWFAVVNVVLCVLWLILAARILVENAKMSAAARESADHEANA